MTGYRFRGSPVLFVLTLMLHGPGCGDDTCASEDNEAILTDAHNYSYDGTMDVQPYDLAEIDMDAGPFDLSFTWSELTTDMQGHALDPATDVQSTTLAVFPNLSQDEVETRLAQNTMYQSDMGLFGAALTDGGSSVSLSDHTVMGNDIDIEQYFVDGYGTWLFTLNTGTTAAENTRMAAFLVPVPGEKSTALALSDDSAIVEVEANLSDLQVQRAEPDQSFVADWRDVTSTGQGLELNQGVIDQVMVAWYAELEPADLEAEFMDIELLADEIWSLEVSGVSSADLAELEGASGNFGGISDQGTWILALRCTSCPSPAPPFLTRLEVCE